MMKLQPMVAPLVALALLATSFVAAGAPLSSCDNIGYSSGNYNITGTIYRISAADSISDANALTPRRGDAVLFEAGGRWSIGSEDSRLRARSGVLYGRYGEGPNPVIVGSGVTFSVNFRGLIEAEGVDDVIIDGIDVSDSHSFGIMVRNSNNVIVRNLTVSNTNGGGITFIGNPTGTGALIEGVEIFAADGGPHESITFDNFDGFTVRHVRSRDNGHAAINIKGNSRNGEVYASEFAQTGNDPTLYMERAENIHIHDNWIHTNVGSSTRKALISLGIENYGDPAKHYVRNIEINDNVIEDAHRIGIKFFLKETIANDPARAERIYSNIHIHHNAIVTTGQEGLEWASAIQAADGRNPPDPNDWDNIVIENNIIWDTGVANAIALNEGVDKAFSVRYNLFEAGETGYLGANAVMSREAPFVDIARKNFDPAGAALRAGSDGGDIGATIEWTCGSNAPESRNRPMPPKLSAESG